MIRRRKIFLMISAAIVLLSLVSLFVNGLNLSIDFTGGTRLEILPEGKEISKVTIERAYLAEKLKVSSIQETDRKGYRISSNTMTDSQKDKILNTLDAKEQSFEVLGPTIGNETKNKALVAVMVAIAAITTYIAIAFWKSGGVISSWKFGITAIIALIHDVVITLGVFSLFGLLFGVQVDALFITAILTIMGFSVHDTIVVFDRIRENITNNVKKLTFEQIVDNSINDTMGRSLNTSITVVFVLFAMVLFGGESIRWFIIAFIIGVVVGTYSSIFIASPLLLEWYNFNKKDGFRNLKAKLNKKK